MAKIMQSPELLKGTGYCGFLLNLCHGGRTAKSQGQRMADLHVDVSLTEVNFSLASMNYAYL